MVRKALLIGNGTYNDHRLRQLRSPKQDVRALKRVLEDPEIGHFDTVYVLEDEGSGRIRSEIEGFLDSAESEDTVLLYFSCHGVLKSDKLVFAAIDTTVERLRSTGVQASEIQDQLRDCAAKARIVMLDCCYSGAFAQGLEARGESGGDIHTEARLAGEGIYLLTASEAYGYAFEGEHLVDKDLPTSIFTSILIEGLDGGGADLDNDGVITMDEMFRYCAREISRRAQGQKPTVGGNVVEPIELARARNSRARADGLVVGDVGAQSPPSPVMLSDLLGGLGQDPNQRGLIARQWQGGTLSVPVARYVTPTGVDGRHLSVELLQRNGHLLVAGGLQTGKTTLLTTLVLGLSLTHRPHEVRFYVVAGGGMGLSKLARLPHVTAVVGAGNREGVSRLTGELETLLDRRAEMLNRNEFDDMEEYRQHRDAPERRQTNENADVFLVIDDWLESAAHGGLSQLATRMARSGPNHAFHLAVSVHRAAELPEELLPMFHTLFELQLDDPEHSVFTAKAQARPRSPMLSGWGLDQDGRRFVVAVPQFSGSSLELGATRELIRKVAESYGEGWRRLAWAEAGAGADAAAEPFAQPAAFEDLLGIGDPDAFDPLRAWARTSPEDRLRVPIGVDEGGEPVVLDLKEAALGGMGPHGLCIGATGSGKSEVLRTLVLALGVSQSSEYLNFILCDFKGGATFAGMATMPHTAAVITNMADDLTMVDRMRDAINGELYRRQELLLDGGNFKNTHDYERARAAGSQLIPMPSLLIVIDEFSEMLAAKPDLLELFIQIGRIGRSLGVHLLLASQRLEEGRLRGLETFLSYRLGLKTFSAAESRIVLGVPDAATLPSIPGSGYLKTVGTTSEVGPGRRFKAAYVSGPARAGEAAQGPFAETLLELMVRRLENRGPEAHQVWLPPLSSPATLDQLMPDLADLPDLGLHPLAYAGAGRLRTPIGIVDKPIEQKREVYEVDLSGAAGHAVIVGGPRSGKSTLVRTLVTGLALGHTPLEVQFFGLDFGGGSLLSMKGLPHMSGVGGRLDVDVVRRIISEVVDIIEKREETFRAHQIDTVASFRARRGRGELPDERFGDVFLVIDGWQTLRTDFELLEQDVLDIAQRGLGYGVHVVLTAARWAEVRSALKDLVNTRIELRLGDPMESDVDRKIAQNVPIGVPGRGITRDRRHFLAALPRIDGVEDAADLGDAVARTVDAIARAWQGPAAPELRMLPLLVPYTDLPEPSPRPAFAIPLGVDESKLEPVYLNFNDDPHFLMFGDGESGKTSVLRSIIKGITEAYTGDQARILIVDYRRSLLGVCPESHALGYCASAAAVSSTVSEIRPFLDKRQPGADVTQDQLRNRSWWTGPEIFVVVDDYDLVATGSSANPLAPFAEYLPMARDLGFHLIVARASGGASRSLFEPVIQRLRELRQPGLLLSADREEGQLVGTVRGSQQPPGRGTFVSRRRRAPELIQAAYLPPPE